MGFDALTSEAMMRKHKSYRFRYYLPYEHLKAKYLSTRCEAWRQRARPPMDGCLTHCLVRREMRSMRMPTRPAQPSCHAGWKGQYVYGARGDVGGRCHLAHPNANTCSISIFTPQTAPWRVFCAQVPTQLQFVWSPFLVHRAPFTTSPVLS